MKSKVREMIKMIVREKGEEESKRIERHQKTAKQHNAT